MHILALVTDAFGGHGGIAQYNRDLLTALANSERISSITAVPRYGASTGTLPRGLAQRTPSPSKVRWSLRLISEAIRSRPDVIFCGHMNAAPLAAAIGKLIARPVWLQVHGIEAWSARTGLARRAVEASSLITSVSRYTRQRLLSWCNVDASRVRVLPNTLASTSQPRAKRSDLVARHELAGRKVILTVGRMSAAERYKGHDRIIRCLPKVREAVPEVAYLIVGVGDDQPRLQTLSAELGIAEIVRFAGMVAVDEMPDYYVLGDVFAMPSTGEGFGIVFLEAAQNGLPVIGGKIDGSVDALADGRIGRMIDPSSEGELTDALIDALQGRAQLHTDEVRRFDRAHFSTHVDHLVRSLIH